MPCATFFKTYQLIGDADDLLSFFQGPRFLTSQHEVVWVPWKLHSWIIMNHPSFKSSNMFRSYSCDHWLIHTFATNKKCHLRSIPPWSWPWSLSGLDQEAELLEECDRLSSKFRVTEVLIGRFGDRMMGNESPYHNQCIASFPRVLTKGHPVFVIKIVVFDGWVVGMWLSNFWGCNEMLTRISFVADPRKAQTKKLKGRERNIILELLLDPERAKAAAASSLARLALSKTLMSKQSNLSMRELRMA